jgi:RNA polymerase sigma-70 factor (ECF subfamily)
MGDVAEDLGLAARAAEERLVELAGRGDQDAFAVLVERRLETAFRTASAILGNEADARDVVQEAFVSAWVHLPRLRDVGRFDAWLSRIVVNRCRDALRRRRRAREVAIDDAGLTDPVSGPEFSTLNAAFERLGIDQRHLLVAHHLHQQPVVEIARQLGIPVGTVKWRLHAARRALERALEAER